MVSDQLKTATTNGAITSMICLKIDVGIRSAALNLPGILSNGVNDIIGERA